MDPSDVFNVSFPHGRCALWDHRPLADKFCISPTYVRDIELVLEERALRLAHQAAVASSTSPYLCSFLGSALPNEDGEGFNIVLDQFTNSVDDVEDEEFCQAMCKITKNDSMANSTSVEDYWTCLKALKGRCHSAKGTDLSKFVAILAYCSYYGNRDDHVFHFNVDVVLPNVEFFATPVMAVPVMPTALSKSLLHPVPLPEDEVVPKSGYLTMEKTRKLILVLDSDPKAVTLPLVGIWVHGVKSPHHPVVWMNSIRYLWNLNLRDRVCIPPEHFLLMLCPPDSAKPSFYDVITCDGAMNLRYQLFICHEVVSLPKLKAPKEDVRMTLRMNLATQGPRQEMFTAALQKLVEKKPQKDFNLEEEEPRSTPVPLAVQRAIKSRSNALDISLFVKEPSSSSTTSDARASAAAPPARASPAARMDPARASAAGSAAARPISSSARPRTRCREAEEAMYDMPQHSQPSNAGVSPIATQFGSGPRPTGHPRAQVQFANPSGGSPLDRTRPMIGAAGLNGSPVPTNNAGSNAVPQPAVNRTHFSTPYEQHFQLNSQNAAFQHQHSVPTQQRRTSNGHHGFHGNGASDSQPNVAALLQAAGGFHFMQQQQQGMVDAVNFPPQGHPTYPRSSMQSRVAAPQSQHGLATPPACLQSNSKPSNDFTPSSRNSQDHTPQGHTHQGHTHQGHIPQGHTPQGHTPQGHTSQGHIPQAHHGSDAQPYQSPGLGPHSAYYVGQQQHIGQGQRFDPSQPMGNAAMSNCHVQQPPPSPSNRTEFNTVESAAAATVQTAAADSAALATEPPVAAVSEKLVAAEQPAVATPAAVPPEVLQLLRHQEEQMQALRDQVTALLQRQQSLETKQQESHMTSQGNSPIRMTRDCATNTSFMEQPSRLSDGTEDFTLRGAQFDVTVAEQTVLSEVAIDLPELSVSSDKCNQFNNSGDADQSSESCGNIESVSMLAQEQPSGDTGLGDSQEDLEEGEGHLNNNQEFYQNFVGNLKKFLNQKPPSDPSTRSSEPIVPEQYDVTNRVPEDARAGELQPPMQSAFTQQQQADPGQQDNQLQRGLLQHELQRTPPRQRQQHTPQRDERYIHYNNPPASHVTPQHACPPSPDVAQKTHAHLRALGIELDKRDVSEGGFPPADTTMLTSMMLPKVQYVSMLLESDTDTARTADNVALKYLTNEQLAEVYAMGEAKSSGDVMQVLNTESPKKDVTSFGLANVSFATRKYFERYGLARAADRDDVTAEPRQCFSDESYCQSREVCVQPSVTSDTTHYRSPLTTPQRKQQPWERNMVLNEQAIKRLPKF